jgi:hypothetical protein
LRFLAITLSRYSSCNKVALDLLFHFIMQGLLKSDALSSKAMIALGRGVNIEAMIKAIHQATKVSSCA